MKNIFVLTPILFFLFTCKEPINQKKITEYKKTDTLYIKELSSELYKFDLLYSKDPKYDLIKLDKILVTDKSRGLPIQKINIDTIEIGGDGVYFSNDEDVILIADDVFSIADDVNFDGYKDICLLNYQGNYNASFSYFIFDKENENFKHYKGLDTILNPVLLSNKKMICSQWHIGVNNVTIAKYFWRNNSLILKEKYEEEWRGDDKGYLTITKLVNNKYMVKDSIIKDMVVEKINCE